MNEKYKDTDLREALRRKYADTPKLPADFMKDTLPRREGRTRVLRWMAAAACLLIIVGVGFTLMPKDEPAKTAQVIVKQTTPKPVPKSETPSSQAENSQFQSQEPSVPKSGATPLQLPRGGEKIRHKISQREDTTTIFSPSGETEGGYSPNLHYAAHDPAEETEPYQDPARVDEFIEKMAAYHNVKEGQLKCGAANDSNVVSRVYVFPDKKEVDVFGRLLQVACCYSDETPGYHLNFSHQQFFFELKDQRRQLQYRWIAERINGRILLYGTNAPIGAQTTSACYQEYRNELMTCLQMAECEHFIQIVLI